MTTLEAKREYQRNYYKNSRAKHRAKVRRYYDKNKQAFRERWYLRNYGLSLAEYEALLVEQEGACAVCRQPEVLIDARTGAVRNLCVDHSHTTGEVRGLLCSACNIALGKLKDSVEVVERALAYLKRAL